MPLPEQGLVPEEDRKCCPEALFNRGSRERPTNGTNKCTNKSALRRLEET
jgi:hypothetical protein